jgi:hypothetical protein
VVRENEGYIMNSKGGEEHKEDGGTAKGGGDKEKKRTFHIS